MFDVGHYFIFGALISLAIITYSDFKTLKIDDRRNWFMQGYTLALALMGNVLLFYVVLTFLMFFFGYALKKYETFTNQTIFGDGDKKLLNWLVPGFVLLNLLMPVVFFVCLMDVLIILTVIKVFKKDFQKKPGMLYITIAFLLSWAVYLIL